MARFGGDEFAALIDGIVAARSQTPLGEECSPRKRGLAHAGTVRAHDASPSAHTVKQMRSTAAASNRDPH